MRNNQPNQEKHFQLKNKLLKTIKLRKQKVQKKIVLNNEMRNHNVLSYFSCSNIFFLAFRHKFWLWAAFVHCLHIKKYRKRNNNEKIYTDFKQSVEKKNENEITIILTCNNNNHREKKNRKNKKSKCFRIEKLISNKD